MKRIFNNENKVIHSEIASYLSEIGFRYCWDKNSPFYKMLLRIEGNKIYSFELEKMPHFMRKHMNEMKLDKIQIETFTRGINTYLSQTNLKSVDEFESVNFRDNRDTATLYFNNCVVKVQRGISNLEVLEYDDISAPIWAEKILNRDFNYSESKKIGDFENFCFRISGESETKFKRLKSLLGYLIHTYKDPTKVKTVVFYDQINTEKKVANGGTGKTLISQFISKYSKLRSIDGKDFNPENRFAFQNVNADTEVVSIDDVKSNFQFDPLFAKTSSDFQIEKKGLQIINLDYANSPKIMITSNSLIGRPEGSSSKRRLEEFYLDSPFSDEYSPIDVYGKRFFDDWIQEDWNKADQFAIDCLNLYLNEGIVALDELSSEEQEQVELKKAIGSDLKLFFDENVPNIINKEVIRADFRQKYCEQYQEITQIRFTKLLMIYCKVNKYQYNNKSKGGKTYLNICNDNL